MIYDLIIIGGGPAGMTAAIYAARKQMKFAIIYRESGGEVEKTTYIENYPGIKSITGPDLARSFEEHMKHWNVEHYEDEVQSVQKTAHNTFITTAYGGTYESKTILITSGANPRTLNIPGEMQYKGRGVSWCATCDGPLFKDKTVAIIGTGNTGLTSAIALMEIAKKVYLINKNAKPKADQVLVEKALSNPKVEMLSNASTKIIHGEKFVTGITVDREGKETFIPVDGVFVNIGYDPNTAFLGELVALDPFKYIIVGTMQETSVPGIYAAGDVTNNPQKQIVIAAGEGAKALLNIYDYLAKQG